MKPNNHHETDGFAVICAFLLLALIYLSAQAFSAFASMFGE